MECWIGWVVHVLLGSTCTTPHISLYFKAIFTLLAVCAKWMLVHVLL